MLLLIGLFTVKFDLLLNFFNKYFAIKMFKHRNGLAHSWQTKCLQVKSSLRLFLYWKGEI